MPVLELDLLLRAFPSGGQGYAEYASLRMSSLLDIDSGGTPQAALKDPKTLVLGRQDSHSPPAIHPSKATGRRVDLKKKVRVVVPTLVLETEIRSKSRAFACSRRCAFASCEDERRNSCLARLRCHCDACPLPTEG